MTSEQIRNADPEYKRLQGLIHVTSFQGWLDLVDLLEKQIVGDAERELRTALASKDISTDKVALCAVGVETAKKLVRELRHKPQELKQAMEDNYGPQSDQ